MSIWFLVSASVLLTLLASMVLAERLSLRFASHARQRLMCSEQAIHLADPRQAGLRFSDPFAAVL